MTDQTSAAHRDRITKLGLEAKRRNQERIAAVVAITNTLQTFQRQRSELAEADNRCRDALRAVVVPLVGHGRYLTYAMVEAGRLDLQLFNAVSGAISMHAGFGDPLMQARSRADSVADAIDREIQSIGD